MICLFSLQIVSMRRFAEAIKTQRNWSKFATGGRGEVYRYRSIPSAPLISTKRNAASNRYFGATPRNMITEYGTILRGRSFSLFLSLSPSFVRPYKQRAMGSDLSDAKQLARWRARVRRRFADRLTRATAQGDHCPIGLTHTLHLSRTDVRTGACIRNAYENSREYYFHVQSAPDPAAA